MSGEVRIALREYAAADVERLALLADDELVSRYLAPVFPHPYTRADAEWWISTGCREDGVTRAVEADGELVGGIGVRPGSGWTAHTAEIGYWIGRAHWGRGIATAAVSEMTALALGELGFEKLFAPVLAPNRASMRVLEKCGYALEGVLASEVEKQGRRYDVHRYARLRG